MQKLSTTLIAVLALACAAAEPVFADDRQDIEAAVTRFEQAVNAGDAAAIAAMYTEDAAPLCRPARRSCRDATRWGILEIHAGHGNDQL